MSKHRVVYLPLDALEANLDDLSAQGWEFVTWVDPFSTGIYVEQRRALLRRVEGLAMEPVPVPPELLSDIRDQAMAGYDPNPLNT